MWAFWSRLLDPTGFPPRWHCGPGWAEANWLGWLHIVADLATFAAYFAVPMVVTYYVARHHNVKFPPIFYVFLGLIFFSCGTVHLVEAGTFWWPVYRLSGLLKAITAVVSCFGVVLLVKILPKALELRSGEAYQQAVRVGEQAQQSLDFEQNLLFTLMNNLPAAIYFKDQEGRFLRISKSLAHKFHLEDPLDAVGKSDADFFSDEHANQARVDEECIMATGEPVQGIIERETWLDRDDTWVSTYKGPLRNKHGELIGTFGISHDVTKIKQADERLSRIAAQLALPRGSSEGEQLEVKLPSFSLRDMILCGADIRALSLRHNSRSAFAAGLVRQLHERMVGVEGEGAFALVRFFCTNTYCELEDELQEVARQALGGDPAPDTKCLRLVATAGDHRDWNDVLDSKSHRVIPLPSLEAVEQLPMISQLIRQLGFDVAGLLQGNGKLLLPETSTNVFHVAEAQGSPVIPAQEDFVVPFGIRSVVGFGDVLPSGQLFAVICFSKVPVSAETATLFSHLVLSTRLALLAYEAPATRVESQIVSVDHLLRNYEEVVCRQEAKIHETMRDVMAARDAADTANRAKSEFLANMSHEIRTPMNAIIGMTELVLESTLTRTQRDYLGTVLESGESLLAIINEILDFSKIEAGKLELEKLPFSLREELGDTMKAMAVRAHRKQLELAWHVDADVPDFMLGDASRLRQVIINLTNNAIKFTHQGEVYLNVRLLSQQDNSVELQFSIKDTGVGIPQEKLPRIFEAFEQADTSTTRNFGGTGLGLSISSRLVELHGGRMWARSQVGQGSTFYFTMEYGLCDESQVPRRSLDPTVLHDVQVLVVDDNATNRHILGEMLTTWGMRPIEVDGGRQALEALEQLEQAGKPIPLVLSDIHMPEIDGFMLAEQIRDNPELSGPAIIALTSGARVGDAARCEELGIAAELLKPVKQSELLNAILAVAAPNAAAAGAAEQEQQATEFHQAMDILLVEDGLANQKLAKGLLELWGHQVTIAANGVEALEAWQQHAYDLILMDLQMPEMDGLTATQRIREREAATGAHVPIIAMTAHAMKGDRERCLNAGMDGYVSKPVRKRELSEALREVMGDEANHRQPGSEESGDATEPADVTEPTNATPPGSAAEPSAATEPAERPGEAIDWSLALEQMGGSEDLLKEIVPMVIEELPKLLDQLRAAVAEGDGELVQRMAHTIKGTVRVFGTTSLESLAQNMEDKGREQQLDGTPDDLVQLAQAAAALLVTLRKFLEQG